MKAKEFRQKSIDELKRLLAENRERLRQLRFDVHLKQSKNVREIRKTKKDVAKLLTVLQEGEK